MHAALQALHNHFHDARADLFVNTMKPRRGDTLLDLGGSTGSLAASICRRVPLHVTVADVDTFHRAAVEAFGFCHVQLSDTGPLPFATGQFDFVLSNSVLEHVTLPKGRCHTSQRVSSREWKEQSERSQQEFAEEIRRVGSCYFVQTPHKHFPIDPHVYLPFVQYLPHNLVCRIVPLTDRYWLNDCGGTVDWHLLTARRMSHLFPDGQVIVERFIGLPKSIIAFRKVDACP